MGPPLRSNEFARRCARNEVNRHFAVADGIFGMTAGVPTPPLRRFGTPDQADVPFKWYFSLCGRSATATRSSSGIARPGAGCKGPRPPRLSKPDAVLSPVPSNDRGDTGGHAPEAAVGKSGMAAFSHSTFGDNNQS